MASAAPAIPGYRVVGLLGQGGMGQVFLAEDETLGRKVAIKTILPAVSGEGAHRARFLREARAMATVEHPRVVRVYSFGEAAGQAYFVMELVEGETLAARLARTPRLSLDEALRIGREVAEALAAAWARGIVHRDVKPSNIILDAEGHVHVTDFGLARPVDGGGDASITREGAFVGSPHYVAPEQARAQATDCRTDIYSLGIVIYEMLAGRRPFDGRSPAEVISRQLTEQPPPLDAVAPGTPEPVARLVKAMTEKEPMLRPASYPTLIASLSGTWRAEDTAAGVASAETSSMPTLAFGGRGAPPVTPRARSRWLTTGVPALVVPALLAAWMLRDSLGRTPRPPGELVVTLTPFYGADEESAKEARTLATLVESETRRLLGEQEGKAVGLSLVGESARSGAGARRLGNHSGADLVLWGEVVAFRGDVEAQPAVTWVSDAEPAPRPRLASQLFEAQAGNAIEVRRRGAARIAEAVLRLAAQRALDRGHPETARDLLRELEASAETLTLRAAALERLGRDGEAAAARREAERLLR